MKKCINPKKSIKTSNRIGIVMGIAVALVVTNVLFTMVTGVHLRSGENILSRKAGSGETKQTVIANRGNIYDRNGDIIAQDIESYDLYAYISEERVNAGDTPVYVVDYETTSQQLAAIIEADESKVADTAVGIKKILGDAKAAGSYQTELGKYGKNLSVNQKRQIEELKLPGLGFTKSTNRVYPSGTFASQLIGYTKYDDDGNLEGVSGFEATFNEELTGSNGEIVYQTDANDNRLPNTEKVISSPVNGNDVYVTLDKDTQLALEKALQNTMETNDANKAWAVVMDAKTGEILAQAGYPTYDLNTKEGEGMETNQANLPSSHTFEVGSVMKAFVYAAVMNEGLYDGLAKFQSGVSYIGIDENNNPIRIGPDDGSPYAPIYDAEQKDRGIITYDEGLIYSTNSAIISLISNVIPVDTVISYLTDKFKLFDEVDVYGVDDNAGALNTEYPIDKATLGFGQGASINTYQLMQAASAIFGDGTMLKPYVIEKIVDPNTEETVYQGQTEEVGEPISAKTAKELQGLLERVVTDPNGTAKHYKMTDVTMMAKTGTGEVSTDGKYGKYYTNSILAAAPADDPQIIIYYAFESEQYKNYDTSYFQDVVREALNSLNQYNAANERANSNNETTTDYAEYQMPALVNHSTEYVKQKLEGYNIKVHYIGDGSSIISQSPAENTTIISGQNVFLLTDGMNITMPNMSGWSRKDVAIFAKFAGIEVTYNGSGKVATQNIRESAQLNKESKLEVELK